MALNVIDDQTMDFIEGMSKTQINSAIDQKIAAAWYLSTFAVTLNINNMSAVVNVIGNNLGTITASSSATSKATVSVNGKAVIINAVAAGSATITINESNSGTSKTVTVTVSGTIPAATLNSNSPEQIQAAARAGIAKNLWSVGDRVGIAISGTVGILSLNHTRYAYILGFDHNSAIEGINTIHFGFGFSASSSGANIAYCDANYGNSATSGFIMDATASDAGGWAASYMRNTVCPSFFAAMPAAWQAIIMPCVKYTDNVGGTTLLEASVTPTADNIFLLAQYEITGAISQYINPAEPIAQQQYAYYANGNSKIKYKHSATSTAVEWWTRSPRNGNDNGFRKISTDGSAVSTTANTSLGFAPAFMVA